MALLLLLPLLPLLLLLVVFGAGDGIKRDDAELLLLLLQLFSLGLLPSALKLNCRVTSSRVFNCLITSPFSNGFVSTDSFLISFSILIALLWLSTVKAPDSFCGSSILICGSIILATTTDFFSCSASRSFSFSFSSLMTTNLLELLLLLLRLLSELRRRSECEFDEQLDDDDGIC